LNGKSATFLRDLPGLGGMVGKKGLAQFSVTSGNVAVLGLRFKDSAFTSIPSSSSSSTQTGVPASIQIISGNSQTSFTNREFNAPLVVKVLDSFGKFVVGTPLRWSISANTDAILIAPSSVTDSFGQGSALVEAGGTTGTVTITVAAGSVTAQFTLN